MKITQRQLRKIVGEEVKRSKRIVEGALKFEDVSPFAHDAGLYKAVGDLYMSLLDALVEKADAEKWLRELVQDAVDSEIDDVKLQDDEMDTSEMSPEETRRAAQVRYLIDKE